MVVLVSIVMHGIAVTPVMRALDRLLKPASFVRPKVDE
jgi:hypothetical protein